MPRKPAATTKTKPLVSIICPVYNEAACVPIFFDRLNAALEPLAKTYAFELIFTNNASEDETLELICDIRENKPWVQVITLSRNFGYQASLTCGLANAAGDATVIIDVDCEDPPEMIPKFIAEWEQGFDIVYGERLNRPESGLMLWARRAFYRLTNAIADNDFIIDMAEFSLFTRAVRESILDNASTFPFIRNEIAYAGFRRTAIPYSREMRAAGETHYDIWRMARFAVGGILTASTFPLRLVLYAGAPLFGLDLLAAIYAFFSPANHFQALLFLNLAFISMALACGALYLARIYKDGVGRPLYITDQAKTHLDRPLV